ncbi:MAG: VWA domain-containing protein [Acidobacteria bacterium]|nr:MAG: VWA domain-containing protein [Acidobacteriota bacterium]
MKKFFGLLLIGCFFAGPAVAQTAQESKPTENPAGNQGQEAAGQVKVQVNLVNVLYTVVDKKGRLLANLTKNDFSVFEDGKPQTIRFFGRESNLPLRIGILIDTSNSIRLRLQFEQEAAIDFLYDTVRPDKDQAFVVGFDVEPVMVQDYTDNLDKLKEGINSLQAGGGTGLYDAIYYACKEKMIYTPQPEPYLRRVLIVVSDGQDNFSEYSREEALSMAQKAEATIYAISTNWTGVKQRGDKVLEYLAKETGGGFFFNTQESEMETDFKRIANELRSQYSLAYVSTNAAHDGTFRKISIKTDKKDLRVQAKTGYFAPSQ